ncbi:MAG TPA: FliM/FliN family flagellar motor switch protein [Sedimentisphaerales bacterium]|jgi:flagellar motor switch protein FliN/FliY|nr:FliM/FliN family flagellar motor switch protein [Sedimentisphaerales bacterium]HNU27781.1 FliM/FliN family flagellar motor switch protein [Sedimentisphaerales bacterium]
MPNTAVNAPVESPVQEDPQETTPQGDGKTQVRSVEFPSAPQSAVAAGTGQLDILLDMDIPITVVIGTTQIPVRRLLQLGPGSVLQLEKPVETPVDLFMKDSKFAEADVVVVENRFAVRIRQIVGAGAPAATQG